jgi:hypothetical protein
MNIAMIAANVFSRSGSNNPPAQADRDGTVGSNQPWRRSSRTQAARGPALLDPGCRTGDLPHPTPGSSSMLQCERWLAQRKRRWMKRLVEVQEAERAYVDAIELQFRLLLDFAAGLEIKRRNPQLVRAMGRFRLARRRAMRLNPERG